MEQKRSLILYFLKQIKFAENIKWCKEFTVCILYVDSIIEFLYLQFRKENYFWKIIFGFIYREIKGRTKI